MAEIKKEIKIIKKRILSFLVIVFMFIMIFSVVNVGMAANTDQTSLSQNITAGSLDAVVTATLEWADLAVPGLATNSNAVLSGVNVSDSRGNWAGWTLTVYANNLQGIGGNVLDIENRLIVGPKDVTTTSNAAAGSDFHMANTAGSQQTFLSATVDNGGGTSTIDNSLFNLRIEPTDNVSDYTATVTFTIS